ncbi:MAG: ATP synthase F1 subunit gamma [Anaerolineales bacterium]|jgi:F-type H+-transporting ATPase subunit gamma
MSTAREVKQRIRSVKNIAQVTRALQAVSASKVQKAMQAMMKTRPYATKAWQVLTHVAAQPGRENLHPLLDKHEETKDILLILISGDRGLAGAYNTNVIRFALNNIKNYDTPVHLITVGRKGRDIMIRRGQKIFAEFSDLPDTPTFADISAIGRLAVDEFLAGNTDEVYLVYTDYVNMVTQNPAIKKLLPLEVDAGEGRVEDFGPAAHDGPQASYIYEPGRDEILDEIVPRFTALQVYQAVLESQASEHAARMVAMKNATDNATDLSAALQLEYNKARQFAITSEMLDIAGGAEALAKSS